MDEVAAKTEPAERRRTIAVFIFISVSWLRVKLQATNKGENRILVPTSRAQLPAPADGPFVWVLLYITTAPSATLSFAGDLIVWTKGFLGMSAPINATGELIFFLTLVMHLLAAQVAAEGLKTWTFGRVHRIKDC